MRAAPALCIPHVGGHILPWEHFPLDTAVVPLLEITAMHGRFERFAQEALQFGYKLGFVGMSDGHFGRPGYDNWSQHGRTPGVRHRNYSAIGGITGYLVDTFTREAILDAMRSRRTIATSGARIAIALDADGHPMGSEYTTDAPPQLRISVNGSGPIDLIEIIRGDRRALRHQCDGACDCELDWTDPTPLRGETWYYIRVTQRDNAIAWTSPVWVTCTAPTAIDPTADELPAWDAPPHWPPDDPQSADPAHTRRLADIFAKRGLSERFRQIEARGLFTEQRGRYACFRARDTERDDKIVRIHLYVDFPDDRLYIVDGESEYGQYYKWE
ncbi:MAG: DUF3604 domain-containing protein [Planctomycetota bacterium]